MFTVLISHAQMVTPWSTTQAPGFMQPISSNGPINGDFRSGMDALKKKDYPTAYGYFLKASDDRDNNAMFAIAGMYESGAGVAKDSTLYLEWLNKSANAGSSRAMYSLGYLYDHGKYVSRDSVIAVKWLIKSGNAGNSNAMVTLGIMYDYGKSVKKDTILALKWINKAAEAGNNGAMSWLGYKLDNGQSVAKDSVLALKWYNKAAEAGNGNAMYQLAFKYDNGKSVAKDSVLALKWYIKGAQAGNANAENNLGVKYSKGRWVKKDYAVAFELFKKSAATGNMFAMCNLGEMYEYGRGVGQNDLLALQWYSSSFQKGADKTAAYHLAQFYESGRGGLSQDYKIAMQWYLKCVNTSGAMQHIGFLYENGKGVATDTAEAIKWYQQAADKNNGFGFYYLGRLEKDKVKAEQLFQKARAWFVLEIASTLNDTESMRALASMYENGYGSEKNNALALTLYKAAASWGDQEAVLKVNQLEK